MRFCFESELWALVLNRLSNRKKAKILRDPTLVVIVNVFKFRYSDEFR
jgi:hypothetical protein